MKSRPILDTVVFDDRMIKDMKGIVDFSNSNFIHFFDFSNDDQIDLIVLAIKWRLYYPDLRFSVFCSIYYPKVQIPQVILINKKHATVESGTKIHRQTGKVKKKRFLIKKQAP